MIIWKYRQKRFRVVQNVAGRWFHGYQIILFCRENTGKKYYQRYTDFVETYKNKKILLLELGVGDMTPSVIKLPFWDMTYNLSDTFLVSVNLDAGSSPEHLNGKCLTINEDLLYFLRELRRQIH